MGVHTIKPAFQRSLLALEDALVARSVHSTADDLRTYVLEMSGRVRLDRTVRNHYDAQDAAPNVVFASERR